MIQLGNATLYHGDCLTVLRSLPDNSVDSIVTDPPYGLGKQPDALAMLRDWLTTGHHDVSGAGFMGKKWDAFVPQPTVWAECLRVVKPGGHLLAFGGTRTYDLVVLGLRIAGWEIRDQIAWVYGSGFPKSLDVSKAIDAAAGAEREKVPPRSVIGHQRNIGNRRPYMDDPNHMTVSDVPVTAAAAEWEGWGTALKPAHEPIVVARKPLDGTVAATVLAWGTGGLNIDGCRVPLDGGYKSKANGRPSLTGLDDGYDAEQANKPDTLGRFPANLIHDGSPEVLDCFPNAPGQQGKITGNEPTANGFSGPVKFSGMRNRTAFPPPRDDASTSAARFFYCAKASKSDRGDGNDHPTVKPNALMRYLCRLVTPPGGVVLDHYAGSGSTGRAAIEEGFKTICTDSDEHNFDIACTRVGQAVWGAICAYSDAEEPCGK